MLPTDVKRGNWERPQEPNKEQRPGTPERSALSSATAHSVTPGKALNSFVP